MSIMEIGKIIIKNGLSNDLPKALSESELAFTTDTGELFIGAPSNSQISYRGGSSTQDPIYPYQNIKIITELDLAKAVSSESYAITNPLVRYSIPISTTLQNVYTFSQGLDTLIGNYSLYSPSQDKAIFVGTIRISQNLIWADNYSAVNFDVEYSNNIITLQATNTSTEILTMNLTAQIWQSKAS